MNPMLVSMPAKGIHFSAGSVYLLKARCFTHMTHDDVSTSQLNSVVLLPPVVISTKSVCRL